MREFITIEDIDKAYRDCCRHKGDTPGCAAYKMDYLRNNYLLYKELNAMSYEPGPQEAFLVFYPCLREVVCSQFRDRVVHHLLKLKFFGIFEREMIDDAYACREEKGTEYGVRRLREQLDRVSQGYTREAYVLTGDMRGFFMSINRQLVYNIVEDTIRKHYHEDDIEYWLWLWKLVILTPPEDNCVRVGNLKDWDMLPDYKSIFKTGGRGLTIGNLPSQMLENLLLSIFDKWVLEKLRAATHSDTRNDTLAGDGNPNTPMECGYGYGRYVDDFYVISTDKNLLLKIYNEARVFLKARLDLNLHPNKFYLQEVNKGVRFVGAIVKRGRVYARNRTVYNLFKIIDMWNHDPLPDTKRYVRQINSYLGYLSHRDSYAIRYRAWDTISHKDEVYCVNMRKIRIMNKKTYKSEDIEDK